MSQLTLFGNFIMGIAAWVMVYTGLPVEPAIILAVLMCVDFFAGVVRSHATGEPITSHKIKIGAASKCGILMIPLVVALSAKGVGVDLGSLVSWSISLFILSEAYSIISNIYTAKTGIEAPEFDAISAILKRIQKTLNDFSR